MAHKSSKEESAYTLAGLTIDLFQKIRNDKTFLSQISWFNNLPEVERKQLSQGSYELVKKQGLIKGNVITLAAANGPISLLFSESKTGRDKQSHLDDFKELISKVPHIEVPEMKVQPFTLKKSMNNFEIRDELGGNDNLCFKSKAEALRAVGSTMTDTYRDGKATIVYYLGEEGELCSAQCRWSIENSWWICDAYLAGGSRWRVDRRVLCSAT